MKKLIVALFASATGLFASAKVLTEVSFEENLGGFSGTGGTRTEYENDSDKPGALYPFQNGGEWYCDIDSDGDKFSSPESPSATYFDMNVKFTVRADGDTANLGDDAKLAVYLNSTGNIVVRSGDSGVQPINTGVPGNPDAWTRLTIEKAGTGFKVYVNRTAVLSGKVFKPIVSGTATQVAFDGSGALDNFVARTTDPFYARTTEVVGIGGETGGEYFDEVSNDAIAAAAAANLPLTLYGDADFTATLNAGNSFTLIKGEHGLTGFDASKYDVVGNTYTRKSVWSDYLGEAVAGAYEIDDLDELKKFQENVGQLVTVGETFKLTADIALDAPWPGIGVQNAKDLVSYTTDTSQKGYITPEEAAERDALFATASFKGTFDGQNHTISGFQIIGKGRNAEGLDYAGFFNSANGATIQNLKIQYAGSLFAADTTASTKESGATFVGVAKDSTLRNLTTIAGTVSCSKGFGGIVGYLYGSTVDSCTNNVNMTSLASNKCGGIAMICQKADCSISNCENNGTMTTDSGEHGGIVGYTDDIAISDCNNTAACKMFYHHGGTVALSGENKGSATVASYTGVATPGLNFATVDGNVATFVSDDALALDGEYKVMSAQAAATYNFDAAGTIAFDTAVATPASTNITAVASLGVAGPKVVGSVSTYSAGVAAVDDIAYATFADAVDALDGATDDYVTLLADMQTMYTLDSEGTQKTLKVKTNNHCCLVNVGAEDVLVYQAVGGVATYVSKHGVATFNNTNYLSLLSAIEAAAAAAGEDKTVTLLADVTLDDRILITKSVTIDLAGYSITRTAAPNKDNGSAFRVDGDCTVMIKGGTIDCSGVDDSTVLDDGVFAIDAKNGASLTLTNLTVTVNSKNGACVYPWAGSSVTILDGTYANTTQEFYGWERFKNVQKGMAVNQANKDKTGNVAQQLITIYGGSFKQLNPALGDDSWSDGEGTFLASGYVATWNPSTGYYDVAEKTGIDAGESQAVVVDPTGKTEEQQKAEAEAAVELAVTIPGDVSTEIEKAGKTLDQPTYQDYFKKVATPGTGADEGKWVVTAELDETKVFTATESEEAATEQSILAAALGEESTAATVRAAKPGLYYSMEASNDIGFAAGKGTLEGDRTLATGTTVDIEKPNTPSGNAVFFRVKVSRTDK